MVTAAISQEAPSALELFRLLGDAGRVRTLALCAEAELTVSELAELMSDSQPQTSRRASPLRTAGLLAARKDGTRTYLRAAPGVEADPVISAALHEGQRLCADDGSLARLPSVLAAREEASLAFFDETEEESERPRVFDEPVLAHLFALAPLLPGRKLAVDVGTGEGALLDVLAPLYDRVIALDRSPARLAKAARRVRDRGFSNVRLHEGSFDDVTVQQQVDEQGGADLVIASRVLHHQSRPEPALKGFARLLHRGGRLVLLDYLPHGDERMRELGDVWLGFPPDELRGYLQSAGLSDIGQAPVPSSFRSEGPDAHLAWQAVVGVRA